MANKNRVGRRGIGENLYTVRRISDGRIKFVPEFLARKQVSKGNHEIIEDTRISIVIPYMHSPERERLFKACLKTLPAPEKNPDIEICIHEIGPVQKLKQATSPNYKYMFTKYDRVFNRAWAINVAVREMTTAKKLVLMDGDLIVSKDWLNEIYRCPGPAIGWGQMFYLDEASTERYLKKKILSDPKKTKDRGVRKPHPSSTAGGISLVPRDIFFDVHGIPEDFLGSWGGEDNAFMLKIAQYTKLWPIKSLVYHMYHSHQTNRLRYINLIARDMQNWTREDWDKHTENSKNWGDKNRYEQPIFRTV